MSLCTKSSADSKQKEHTHTGWGHLCVFIAMHHTHTHTQIRCVGDESCGMQPITFQPPRILGIVGDSVLGKHPLRRIIGQCANVMSNYCAT